MLLAFLVVGLSAGAPRAEGAAVEAAKSPSELTAALVARGEAHRAAGRLFDALADLRRGVEAAPSVAERAYAQAAYGLALSEAGRGGAAEEHLRAAIANAGDQIAVRSVAAATLSGVVAGARRVETTSMRAARFAEARELAEMAVEAGRKSGELLHGFALLAKARLAQVEGEPEAALAAVEQGAQVLAAIGSAASSTHLGFGDVALSLGALSAATRTYRAAAAGGGRGAALAALGLSEAALGAGDHTAALAAASKAAGYASKAADDRIGFSADWLKAVTLARAGRTEEAARAYERAFTGLRDFRARSPLGAPPATSARRFAPRRFQLDYIDFLLGSGRSAGALGKARALAEDLKLDDIDDYFAERCTPARGREASADQLAADTVVIYPVVFADRTEIIWTIGEEIGGYAIPLGRTDLRKEITRLRYLIDLRVGGVEAASKPLHDQIIGPLRAKLKSAGVRTIVVAPDGPFRALPLAALWDGEGWLGEQFGLATILGLGLVDQSGGSLANAEVLAAGAEKVSDDYVALPSVPIELQAIGAFFGADILSEEDFVSDALAAEIARRPYGVVHIATHAEFGATPADNFILTSDGKLDITRLEATLRARAIQSDASVDLLTLSACNTATGLDGDTGERAPLGLAGVGFRAGARAVLASLWPADDASTAELMTIFYRELSGGVGRAEALRRAQSALIRSDDASEPFQWANFMLIGDWR